MIELKISEARKYSYNQFTEINKILNKNWTPFTLATKMLEEAGEVASVIMGLEGFKPPDKPMTHKMLGKELSDLLYDVLLIAETYDVDLENIYRETIDAYPKYLIKRTK